MNDLFPTIEGWCAYKCGTQLIGLRKKWCSQICNRAAYYDFSVIKGNTKIIRELLYQIDQGACRMCGVISKTWQADHIVEVYLGGGACNLNNFQTLCMDCHNKKTHRLIKGQRETISSQACSTCLNLVLYDAGQKQKLLLNTS